MSEIAPVSRLPNGAVLVRLPKELDLATKDLARSSLAKAVAESPHLVVDMRGVDFVDCAGLAALMAARSAVLAAGGSIVLVAPRKQAARLLAVARLQSTLPAVPDLRAVVLGPTQGQRDRGPRAPTTATGRAVVVCSSQPHQR